MNDTAVTAKGADETKGPMTSEQLLERLRRALKAGGDFPASAKVVNELRLLVSDPKTTGNQIAEVILREPSLGTRVLHLVNSSFYRRAKPIMTVSQAVIQIGMKPLAEMCASLVLLQKFVPAARRGGSFAVCLQKTIITALLTSSLHSSKKASEPANSSKDECGYLAGTFAELGTLLLAYYFPNVIQAAAKRAAAKKIDLTQGIQDITGLTALQISIEVIDALQLPSFYKEVLLAAQQISSSKVNVTTDPKSPHLPGELSPLEAARNLSAAQEISQAVVSGHNKADLDQVLCKAQKQLNLDAKEIGETLGKLPTVFKDHCDMLELTLPALPEYITSYGEEEVKVAATTIQASQAGDEFLRFVDEIKDAVEQHEPTASVITSVMETLAWSLGFDRVLLLLVDPNRRVLLGRMALGKVEIDPKQIRRPIDESAGRYAPDAVAFHEARPIFNGDPLLDDGWPIMVIPIGFGQRAIGVIYADRVQSKTDEVSSREQAALSMLAELLDRSISMNAA